MPRKCTGDSRDRAMRLVDEAREGTHLSEYQETAAVSARLGVSAQAVTRWRQRARAGASLLPGVTSEESAGLQRLRREKAEFKSALAGRNRINARKVGSQWLIDDSDLDKPARRAGRPPAQLTIWDVANALDSRDTEAVQPPPLRRRINAVFAQLDESAGTDHLQAVTTWAANRGELHHVRAPDLVDLADDARVARSGLAWPRSPVQSIDNIDLYVRVHDWPHVARDHTLVDVAAARADARIRLVAADSPLAREVPGLIAAADLAEVGSARSRAAAARVIEECLGRARDWLDAKKRST
jgi:transposase